MTITENPDLSKILMNALRETFRETRGRGGDETIHLSDLLYPRKAFWNRTVDELPTETEVLYWAAGRAHEDVMARLACMVCKDPPVVTSVPGLVIGEQREVSGISYRPDFRWEWGFFALPAEFKTSRYAPPLPGEESFSFELYLEQLRGYCCLDGVNHGKLIVFFLHAPALVVYDVDFLDSEIERMRQELQERLAAHKTAMANRNHTPLPLCPAGFCGQSQKYLIAPAHCLDCDKDMTVKRAAKHGETKKYKGHTVTAPISGWWYKAKCRYYDRCKPWEIDPVRKQH